jgi:hypothetical protein
VQWLQYIFSADSNEMWLEGRFPLSYLAQILGFEAGFEQDRSGFEQDSSGFRPAQIFSGVKPGSKQARSISTC